MYEGPLDGTQEVLKITFATPYEYNGGNLLVGVYGIEKGTYKSATFSGAEVIGAAVQGYSYSSLDACSLYLRDFVPMTTFSFEPAGGVVYYKPTNVHATDLTPNSAVIAWNPGSNEGAWNVEYRVKGTEEWIAAGSVTEPTITLDVLENGTPYEVRVQADYGDGNLSGWANGSFATPACDEADMGEVEYVLTDSFPTSRTLAPVTWVNPEEWDQEKFDSYYPATFQDEFKAYVESQGGKVTGSVSKKTDYLVNNDPASGSSKNVQLGYTPIILL